jgi:hypothetical protein
MGHTDVRAQRGRRYRHLAERWLLRNFAYQRLDLTAESSFEALCLRAEHRSKGIRRIRVQRIAGNYRETEAGREFSPASFTRKDPEIRPEMRA